MNWDTVFRYMEGHPVDFRLLDLLIDTELSPSELEQLALSSHRLTRKRFGHVMQLFAPVYLSNECVNQCTYCGYSVTNKVARTTLSPDEVAGECAILQKQGIQHLLLVAGEHPKHISINYLVEVISKIRDKFASISIEVAPLEEGDYRQLCQVGVSGLVVYQETYNREVYSKIHLRGPKRDFDNRKDTLLKGARAGMRVLGMGCLWGLAPWKEDFRALMLHAFEVQKQAWRASLSFSFPRICEAEGVSGADYSLSDRDFIKIICLTRLVFPEAHLTLSTREDPAFREKVAPLGITLMSAGSKTNPGGYEFDGDSLAQFETHDHRPVREIRQSLSSLGFDVSLKDWEQDLCGAFPE